jgi:hypothetical protein
MVRQQYETWDRLAVLSLFHAVNQVGAVSGNLMAQKLGFLVELEGQEARLRAAHLKYFRYTMGPYSAALAELIRSLETGGFLTTSRKLTTRGRYIVEYASGELVGAAAEAIAIADRVGTRLGNRSGMSITDHVYELTVPVWERNGERQKVKRISYHVDILHPAADPSLREPSADVPDLIKDLAAEFSLAERDLDATAPRVRTHARNVLRKGIIYLTPVSI